MLWHNERTNSQLHFPAMSIDSARSLETFPNPKPTRDFVIRMRIPEFTCICPKTGQPDFATLYLEYIADTVCIELKSLKLYLWSFRSRGAFHEAVVNQILDDLVAITTPRFMRLTADWYVRGGIYTHIVAEHSAPQWTPETDAPISLPPSIWDKNI